MSRLAPLALVPLFALTGCFGFGSERESLPLVNSAPANPFAKTTERHVSNAPAMKASAERVVQVGQRLILANQEIGLRPLFITVGVTDPEIFHKGSSLGGCQVVVSEGVVRLCPSDGELAAVLALELGKIVTEREAVASPAARQVAERLPPGEAIGTDSGGTFGSADGTRMMELAHLEKRRGERAAKSVPLEPKTLARKYLAKAGYEPASIEQVQPVLRRAEDHYDLEKSIGVSILPPAPPAH